MATTKVSYLLTGDWVEFTLPSKVGLGGYPIPDHALITGGHATAVAVGKVSPETSPRELRTLRDTVKQGRFTGKEKPHEISAMLGGGGWECEVGGALCMSVNVRVLDRLGVKAYGLAKKDGPFLRVLRGDGTKKDPRKPGPNLSVVLEYEFAKRRGLLIEDGGEVFAVTDVLFISKTAHIVWAVGPRNMHRAIYEPGPLTRREEKWDRKKTDDLMGFFGPTIAPSTRDEDFLGKCLAMWAMGVPTRVRDAGTFDAYGLSTGANVFQLAHDRHLVSYPTDPIGDQGRDFGDVTEMVFQAACQGFFEDLPDGRFYDLQDKWLKAGWRWDDRQRDRRYAEMRRGRQLDSKYLEGELELGGSRGNYGQQEIKRIICYRRTAAGDWVVDPAITTWEAWEALPPVARVDRHAVRGAALGPLNAPDAAKRDVLRVTGFLTDVLFAADEVVRAFLRKDDRLERLAGESDLLNDALPPAVAEDFRACCGILAQMMKPLDNRARLAETNLVGFAETQGLGIDVSGHPFSAWLEKQGERTPRGILIPGSDLDRLLRSNCAHAAYIVRVWAVTLAKVYIPRSIPADVSRFMSEFRKEDALGNRILDQLRQPGYQHRFDEVGDWFEGELSQLTARWWKDVWQWVWDLGIGNTGTPSTSTDPDFGSTIAIVDSPSGYRQARRLEVGDRRILSPGPWLRSALVGFFAAYAAATFAGTYVATTTLTALGLGFLVGLQVLVIWRLLEHFIGYGILWRRFRLWFIKTMTGEAEVSIFTVGTWVLPVFLVLLLPATVLLTEMAWLAAPGAPCQDSRNWGCELAMRQVLKHAGSALLASVPLVMAGSYFYKRILGAARHHMFHNIKEPGQHLNFLFTRDGKPLYGWELEQRVFRIVLAVYIFTVSVPMLFAVWGSQKLLTLILANPW